MRILKRMSSLLEKQLTKAVHPIISLRAVQTLVTTIEAMELAAAGLCDKVGLISSDEDAAMIAFYEQPETEKTGREFDRLRKALELAVEQWDDNTRLSRQQIEAYEPTALNLRDRAMTHQFIALTRQVEAHKENLHALLYAHYLQFWVWDDKFQYSGQKQTD
jgi:hypothetical protein